MPESVIRRDVHATTKGLTNCCNVDRILIVSLTLKDEPVETDSLDANDETVPGHSPDGSGDSGKESMGTWLRE